MKLVNVDEINDTTIPMMYLDYNRNDWVQCKIITKDALGVKAIPVEWIRKYIEDIGYSSKMQQMYRELLEAMLEDWEKENGTDR